MEKNTKKLTGQLWEPCPHCGQEPVYLSLGGCCEKCGTSEINMEQTQCNEIYGDEY